MIGLGKWRCSVNHFLYRGNVFMDFFKTQNGYDVKFDLDSDVPFPLYKIIKIEEDKNTIKFTATANAILGEIILELVINGDVFEGKLSIPILGNIKICNGVLLQ